jgi:hypothetical protein
MIDRKFLNHPVYTNRGFARKDRKEEECRVPLLQLMAHSLHLREIRFPLFVTYKFRDIHVKQILAVGDW